MSINLKSKEQVFEKWPFLREIVNHLLQTCGASKVVLFGSRARGQYSKHSDFDIAILSDVNDIEFAKCIQSLEDINRSLADFDFVRMDQSSESLNQKILNEGIQLNE